MAKRFGWMRERACVTVRKRLAAVKAYRSMRGLASARECKEEIAKTCGVTEIEASSVMAWCERYGVDWCENYLQEFLDGKGG